jgi:hypothetical protein
MSKVRDSTVKTIKGDQQENKSRVLSGSSLVLSKRLSLFDRTLMHIFYAQLFYWLSTLKKCITYYVINSLLIN